MKKITIVASMLLTVCLLPQMALGQKDEKALMLTLQKRTDFVTSTRVIAIASANKAELQRAMAILALEHIIRIREADDQTIYKTICKKFDELLNRKDLPTYRLPDIVSIYGGEKVSKATELLGKLLEEREEYPDLVRFLVQEGAGVLAVRTDMPVTMVQVAIIKYGQDSQTAKILLEKAKQEEGQIEGYNYHQSLELKK